MTLLEINLVDVLSETDPDDKVIVWAPVMREGPAGQLVGPRRKAIPLTNGVGSDEVVPGPLMVQVQCKAMSDTRPREVVVPETGPVTLTGLLDSAGAFTYAPPVIGRVAQIRDEAVQAAVDADLAADRAEAAASSADADATQTGLDRTAVAADRTHVDSQVSAIDTAFTESVPPYLQPTALIRDRLLGSPHVDARLEGLWDITTSTEDAAPILNAAADRARAERRPLYIPAPKSYIAGGDGTSAYSIYSTVDFRYLDVYCEANLIMRHTDSVGVIVGDDADRRNGRTVRLGNVKHEATGYFDYEWAHPAVRIVGLNNADVKIANSSLVELYADNVVPADKSVAYNRITLQRVNHLRLNTKARGWVNENSIYGGSYNRITLMGEDFSPDSNTFYKPSVEGSHSLIDFQAGICNVIDQARAEGGARIQFAARSTRNVATSLYIGTPDVIHQGFSVLADLGQENIVSTMASQQATPHTVFSLSPETTLTDTASTLARVGAGTAGPLPSVPGGKLKLPTNYTPWLDTGLMPLESANAQSDINVNSSMSPTSRVTRFNLNCNRKALFPRVYFYDAQGKLLPAHEVDSMRLYAGWKNQSTSGRYYTDNHIYGLPIVVTNPNAKFMRIEIHSGAVPEANRLVDHVTLTAYVLEGHVAGAVDRMRQAVQRPLYGTAAPTRGLAHPGTIIQGPTGVWRAVARVDTSVGSVVSPTEITLATAAGIAVGDVIGILQVGGDTHWTTVAAVGGSTVTLASAPSGTVEVGTSVGTTRWVSNSFA